MFCSSEDLITKLLPKIGAKAAALGSTLYTLTWKTRTTPAGQSVPALRGSTRRATDGDSTSPSSDAAGWPTPAALAESRLETLENWRRRAKQAKENNPNLGGLHLPLRIAAQLASWPTPTVHDTKGTDHKRYTEEGIAPGRSQALQNASQLAAWPTPCATDMNSAYKGGRIRDGKWSTSRLNDVTQLTGPARWTATGELLIDAATQASPNGHLDPAHSRWLMGLPSAWSACAPRPPSKKRKP